MKTASFCRRRGILVGAMVAFSLVGAANAYAESTWVDLQVVDRDTGRPLKVWRHDGHLFIAGPPGARYSLRVSNHSDDRVMVVLSVDGVNILTGQTASYDQNGYVFDAHQSYDVSGWRKSNTQVAAFSFAPLSRSYAARTGRPDDVGVIGMAVFKEEPPPPPIAEPEPEAATTPYDRDAVGGARRGAPAPMAADRPSSALSSAGQAKAADERLGTAHGAREWSEVRTVSFVRATTYPQMIEQFEYDTYTHLVDAGVIPRWQAPVHRPRPFPVEPDGEGYVPDPPGA